MLNNKDKIAQLLRDAADRSEAHAISILEKVSSGETSLNTVIDITAGALQKLSFSERVRDMAEDVETYGTGDDMAIERMREADEMFAEVEDEIASPEAGASVE